MAITFHSEDCDFLPPERRKIVAWVKEVIRAEGFKTGDITYVFCSPEYHTDINRQYLGHDYQTDVITFDYDNSGIGTGTKGGANTEGNADLREDAERGVDAGSGRGARTVRVISGDILINPDRVAVQASEWGVQVGEELHRVMIHGVLHLCGYDDRTDGQRAVMRAKEDACLAGYEHSCRVNKA